jgi:hypothetical protein
MNQTEAVEQGELRKQAGIARAAGCNARVCATQLAFLWAISRAPRRLAEQGLIERVGVELSIRPARHRGYLTRWRACDPGAIVSKIGELRRLLAALEPRLEQAELF